jgi:hypothetical protein
VGRVGLEPTTHGLALLIKRLLVPRQDVNNWRELVSLGTHKITDTTLVR